MPVYPFTTQNGIKLKWKNLSKICEITLIFQWEESDNKAMYTAISLEIEKLRKFP